LVSIEFVSATRCFCFAIEEILFFLLVLRWLSYGFIDVAGGI